MKQNMMVCIRTASNCKRACFTAAFWWRCCGVADGASMAAVKAAALPPEKEYLAVVTAAA
jgi:hypothetical protein